MANFWKELQTPITCLAPMDDVTDYVFRENVATTAKPDVLFTEFTSADALFTKGRDKVAKKLMFSQNQRPIVAQVWGSTPENLGKAASYIEELGFDGIDVNMGCPDKGIMKKNSGAALINNKSLVGEIINAIRKAAPNLPLSIKTRLAINEDLTQEWMSFLLSQNISALTLHGREAKVMSKGDANWEEIGKAVQLKNKINPEIIIIGNGDVKSYEEIKEKRKNYGVDGVMIGRGIFQNPWLFERSENPIEHTRKEYIDLLLKHTKLFNDTWGKTKNFNIMKKFFKIYVRGFHGADSIRIQLMATKNYDEVVDIISKVTVSL
jgi:nifR3 family TIM-barrel protein